MPDIVPPPTEHEHSMRLMFDDELDINPVGLIGYHLGKGRFKATVTWVHCPLAIWGEWLEYTCRTCTASVLR